MQKLVSFRSCCTSRNFYSIWRSFRLKFNLTKPHEPLSNIKKSFIKFDKTGFIKLDLIKWIKFHQDTLHFIKLHKTSSSYLPTHLVTTSLFIELGTTQLKLAFICNFITQEFTFSDKRFALGSESEIWLTDRVLIEF